MIRRLIRCVREYKADSFKAPVFVTLEVILEVIIPFLMAQIIDVGFANGDLPYICMIGAVMVVAAVLSLLCGVLSGKYAAKASAGFAKNVRKDMYHNIQNFAFSNIDRFSTSSLITRLTTDVMHLQNTYQMVIRIFVRSPIMLIVSFCMTIYISPKLALIFLAAIPFLGISLFFIATKAHPMFKALFQKYDGLNRTVQENLTASRIVKAYVRQDHEIGKFKNASSEVYDYSKRAEKLLILNGPIMQFTVYTCILLVSWIGAQMIVSETLLTGQLMSLLTYAMQILSSLMMVSMIFVMMVMSRAAIQRVTEVLDEKSELVSPEDGLTEVKDGSIRFENVSFSYVSKDEKDKRNLEEISLDIKSGQTIGIVGPTGSGKSTLVQMIPRLYDTLEGQVLVGGEDVRKYDLDALRSQVAMVLQKNVLFSGTIRENLRWGNENATDEELERVCKLAQADEFIKTFPDGYDTVLDQGGSNLSGGQKQRLCIARALLKKPKILILDDSTSAVDTHTDALIRRAFLQEIPDTTKLIIAQRISSIQDADQIIVLEEGKISGIGDHETLLRENEIYQDVYESQLKGVGSNA